MSLTWNVENVKDYKDVCFVGEGDERRLSGVADALILMTIPVKLGAITEKNADEFYARLSFLERLSGPFLQKNGESAYFKPEDVRAYVGLYTNVVSESRAKFLAGLKPNLDSRVREYNDAVRGR